MSLNFPEVERIELEDSPLESVICQLQFHEILNITAAPPVKFQEQIRTTFPVLEKEEGLWVVGGTGEQPVIVPNKSAWQFKSEDRVWTVSLANNFIALRTAKYGNFTTFLEHLLPILVAFENEYLPPFYTRIGLRYVNRFYLERTDDKPVSWNKYINSMLTGEFESDILRQFVVEGSHHIVLQSPHGSIGWRYSRDIGKVDNKLVERFTLDFDHYKTGQTATESIDKLLRQFNDILYRFFRWCLTEEGLARCNPKPNKEE